MITLLNKDTNKVIPHEIIDAAISAYEGAEQEQYNLGHIETATNDFEAPTPQNVAPGFEPNNM